MRKTIRTVTSKVMLVYSAAAAVALAALIVAAFIQVVGRYVLNASPGWTEELSRFAFIWCSSLGAAIALDKGSHAAITILGDHLPRGARRVLHLLLTALTLGISVMIAVKGFELAAATINTPSPAMRIPMAYVNIAICFCGAGMALASLSALVSPADADQGEEETVS